MPRPEGVSCARNFAFGAQIRLERICQVERAAEALDQRHRAALRCAPLDARLIRQPSCDHAMHDPQHRADGFGLAGEQEAQRDRENSAHIAAPAAGRTPPPPGAAHSQPCAARRSWGETHADGCTVFRAASSPPIGVSAAHEKDLGAVQGRKVPARAWIAGCHRPPYWSHPAWSISCGEVSARLGVFRTRNPHRTTRSISASRGRAQDEQTRSSGGHRHRQRECLRDVFRGYQELSAQNSRLTLMEMAGIL